jgi:hypothetical protein
MGVGEEYDEVVFARLKRALSYLQYDVHADDRG